MTPQSSRPGDSISLNQAYSCQHSCLAVLRKNNYKKGKNVSGVEGIGYGDQLTRKLRYLFGYWITHTPLRLSFIVSCI